MSKQDGVVFFEDELMTFLSEPEAAVEYLKGALGEYDETKDFDTLAIHLRDVIKAWRLANE